jgi:unsaturated chondroitin disaccharide hydrolase
MIAIQENLKPEDLKQKLTRFWELSAKKIHAIEATYDQKKGAPVFTENGRYTSRGWTEWTHGFQFGAGILQFDATADQKALEQSIKNTVNKMAPHVSHTGVHDHGFNNLSTYGNLLRLMHEGKIKENEWEKEFYRLAIKISGAVQASRWTRIPEGGYIYSFNGPHSLFVDTIRSCRILVASHLLGHRYHAEGDKKISLLERALEHMLATAKYAVYYGAGRDSYDEWGRTAHESVFNVNDGQYRCPNSQQGYSGFSTWTRGLAWAMLGFPEELEVLSQLEDEAFDKLGGKESLIATFEKAAQATCDFYIKNTPTCGVCYWDTGAPNLGKIGDYLNQPADPFNDWEPVDSSGAAIGAQGLLRFGHYLKNKGNAKGQHYIQAGLTVLNTLLQEPYLSTDETHQGLLLHSIYHQPNGWDYVPKGSKIAHGESCMWGDYHIREAAIYVQKLIEGAPYHQFSNGMVR